MTGCHERHQPRATKVTKERPQRAPSTQKFLLDAVSSAAIVCVLSNVGIAVAIALLAVPADAEAQEQAPRGVVPVIVQRANGGDEIRGHLLDLGPEVMTLLVDGARQRVPMDTVRRVDILGDSLRNGALIGAIVGGAWCAFVCGQGLSSSGDLPMAVGFTAVFGAAAGAGIDALIRGRTPIYLKPAPLASAAIAYRVSF